jgi:hypothetical protein
MESPNLGEIASREFCQQVCDRFHLVDLRLEKGQWIAYSQEKDNDVYVTQAYWNAAYWNAEKADLAAITDEDIRKALWICR